MDPISLMSMAGGMGSLLGSVGSSALNWMSQSNTNQMNQQLAQQQMAFQQNMSNTAYQRSVADMKAAGLNPMMMFGSGGPASVPQGAMATMQAPKVEDMGRAMQGAVGAMVSAKQIDKMAEEIATLKTNQSLNNALTGRTVSETTGQDIENVLKRTQIPEAQRSELKARRQLNEDVRPGFIPFSQRIGAYLQPIGEGVSNALGLKNLLGGHSGVTVRPYGGR